MNEEIIKIQKLVQQEEERQKETINLIASENFPPYFVTQPLSTYLNTKYAEGYPGKRYYSGCSVVDEMENEAIEAACDLFGSKYANVQPASGTQANLAIFLALLPLGGKILYLSLNCGGHLSHGSPANLTSKIFKTFTYSLNEQNILDYQIIENEITKVQPDIVVVGFSSYPGAIDFKKVRELCDNAGCYMLADISHISGLVATGEYMHPLPFAHVVSTTTHKTLCGPRGAIILCNDEALYKKINYAVFPLLQSGVSMATIASKAIALRYAKTTEFKKYIQKVKSNCLAMFNYFSSLGWDTVTPTCTHMFVINTLKSVNISGFKAAKLLEECNIILNRNLLPNDVNVSSGIRIGTPAITSRGIGVAESLEIAKVIEDVLCLRIKVEDAKKFVAKILIPFKELNYVNY